MITSLVALTLLSSPVRGTATIQAIPAAVPANAREVLGGRITSNGLVVGSYRTKTFQSELAPQLWSAAQGAIQIPTPQGALAPPLLSDSNDKGEVVGFYSDSHWMKPFRWSAKDGLKDLTEMGPYGGASAINNRGDIAGFSRPVSLGPEHGVLLRDGKRIELRPVEGYLHSNACGINQKGETVGLTYGANVDKPSLATVWDISGNPTAIPMLPGATGQTGEAINDKGEAIGTATLPGEPAAMFFYSHGQTTRIPGGGGPSIAHDLNNKGQIVGRTEPATNRVPFAFLYENGKLTNLNDLLPPNSGWYLERAISINDRGEIVGDGSFKGRPHAFLLQLK